jgi:hypothetical protein
VLSLLAVVVGCAQFKELVSLRTHLIEQYHQDNVEVKIANGKALYIGFINSEFNALDGEQKKVKAREIASFVKGHYPSIGGIESIGVAFVTNSNYVVVNSNSVSSYVFRTNELD